MKKIYWPLVLLCIAYSAQGMNSTIKVSEKCYQNWQQISEDAVILKYYMQGVCNQMGEMGRADVKPSAILQFLRDKSDMDDATQLKYMSATCYLHFFITDENYVDFDKAFSRKHTETQNIQDSWNWFHGHFTEHMKTALETYGKDMMERDAARVTLAEQGVYFKDNGKTIVFNGDRMSEDPKDMQAVKEALNRICKE